MTPQEGARLGEGGVHPPPAATEAPAQPPPPQCDAAATIVAASGADSFVAAKRHAVEEQRQDEELEEESDAPGAAGTAQHAENGDGVMPTAAAGSGRPRRSTAGHLRVEEDNAYAEMEENSEPDAGALADDSDDDNGGSAWQRPDRRAAHGPRSTTSGRTRRRSSAAAAADGSRPVVETVTSGRLKRQRHSRAEDPEMLHTEEAIAAALDEDSDQQLAVAPRTRVRAAPPPAPANLPAGLLPPAVAQLMAASADLPLPLSLPPMPVPISTGTTKAAAAASPAAAAGRAGPGASTTPPAPMLSMPFGVSAMHPMAAMMQAAALSAAHANAAAMMLPGMLLPSFQAAAAFQAATLQAMHGVKPAAASQPKPKPAAAKATPAAAAPPAAAAAPPAAPAASPVKAEPAAVSPPPRASASAAGAAAAVAPAIKQESKPAPAAAAAAAAAAPAAPPYTRASVTAGEKPPPASRLRGASVDVLYGCAKCRYLRAGCGTCRGREPTFTRPHLRWKPAKGHHQTGIEAPPTFRPTADEFLDPIAYISRIKPQAEKYGVAHIVPPPGWDPPFALERGTNGLSMESFRFAVRKQFTSHLCCRAAPTPHAPGTPPAQSPMPAAAGAGGMRGIVGGCMGRDRMSGEARMAMRGGSGNDEQEQELQTQTQAQQQQQPAEQAEAAEAMQVDGTCAKEDSLGSPAAPALQPVAAPAADAATAAAVGASSVPPPDFGFPHLERKHTLRSFSAYADWAKEVHFSDPLPTQSSTRSGGGSTRTARAVQRRPRTLPNFCTQPEPSIEQIEAEFWRIVESPEEPVESLYGQDVDSGHHGSGFPLPLWRRRLLEQHLAKQATAQGSVASVQLPGYGDEEERRYAEHPWNINNMPRCADSVLRYLPGLDGELITGVMVPWLYVGSCLSAFCWHVEDHALCSVNYHHMGAPKVWYTVPARATAALEEAMRDALPHLLEASPRLMYQLVTTLSPKELKRRGVPVYRVVHESGSFVVTMPDSYHSGFNCGFNVAEAVNFAPPSWIPYGTDVTLKYRASGKPLTLSHDSLMVALTQAAAHKPPRDPPLVAPQQEGLASAAVAATDARQAAQQAPTNGPAAAAAVDKERRPGEAGGGCGAAVAAGVHAAGHGAP